MSKVVNRVEELNSKWSAYRRIIYVEKVAEDTYTYRVLSTNGGLVCPVKSCTEEQVKLLPLVFSTDVCNFQVVDGVLKLGWTSKDLDALSELVKNLHEAKQTLLAEEQEDYPVHEEEEDEGNWDDDIPLGERITNPSSRSIDFTYRVNL